MHIGGWMMLAVGIVCFGFEAWRRNWLSSAAWFCMLAGGAVRIAPVPESMSDPIEIALAILFLVLMTARFVIRRQGIANDDTALPRSRGGRQRMR